MIRLLLFFLKHGERTHKGRKKKIGPREKKKKNLEYFVVLLDFFLELLRGLNAVEERRRREFHKRLSSSLFWLLERRHREKIFFCFVYANACGGGEQIRDPRAGRSTDTVCLTCVRASSEIPPLGAAFLCFVQARKALFFASLLFLGFDDRDRPRAVWVLSGAKSCSESIGHELHTKNRKEKLQLCSIPRLFFSFFFALPLMQFGFCFTFLVLCGLGHVCVWKIDTRRRAS